MNEKITFPELVTELSRQSGQSKRICEDFLKELFATISSTLAAGESVKIRRIGTFKVVEVSPRKSVNVRTGETIEISGHRKVTFAPDRELADAVNSPFDAFQTVELSDEITDEMLESVDEGADILTDPDPEFEPLPMPSDIETENTKPSEPDRVEAADGDKVEAAEENKDVAEDNDEQEVIDAPVAEESTKTSATPLPIPAHISTDLQAKSTEEVEVPPEPSQPATEDPELVNETSPDPDDEQEEYTAEETADVAPIRKHSFAKGFIWGIITVLLLIAAAAAAWYFIAPASFKSIFVTEVNNADSSANMTKVVENDSLKDSLNAKDDVDTTNVVSDANTKEQQELVPTQPSDNAKAEPVYDTIGKKRYLTTMAKEHYGNYEFWPYIYEENKSFLGHPDRIKPGTQVVIPPASKYNIDPKNPESVAKAKRLGVQIYQRYE